MRVYITETNHPNLYRFLRSKDGNFTHKQKDAVFLETAVA